VAGARGGRPRCPRWRQRPPGARAGRGCAADGPPPAAARRAGAAAAAPRRPCRLPAHEPAGAPTGRPAACLAVDPQAGARARRAAGRGQGQRAQGPHHAGRPAGLRQARDGGATQTAAQKAKAPAAAAGAARRRLPGLLAWPQVDFAKFGPVERKDLGRIKKISGANLHRNWVLIPHVTNHDDADITELEAFRVQLNKENEKSGVKVTMLAFLIKACVAALKKFPEFNASARRRPAGAEEYFHIGFAADTPNGLVVPVIKDADRKGILQISQEMAELAKKARDGKLGPADMSGGCFSISSLGGIGGRYFTPIINAPEVAILGVCKSSLEPVWDGKAFQPRLMLPLSLSWDHRVIDGAAAARFNAYLGQILATSGACCSERRRVSTVVVARKGNTVAIAATRSSPSARPGCRMATRPTRRCSRSAARGSARWARRRTFRCCGRRWRAAARGAAPGLADEVFDTFLRCTRGSRSSSS
jgi:pyruvate dehydrogenase E2 component (dihydrolipoamide acetyltransferase)